MENEKPTWKSRLWKEWVRPLGVTFLLFMSFRSALADWNDVPTGSMKPTILEGDRIFVNKAAYDLRVPFSRIRIATWSSPEVGDVVVLDSPLDGVRLVKRVVAVPGDRVAMHFGRLYKNGVAVSLEDVSDEQERRWADEVQGRTDFSWEMLGSHRHPIMSQSRGGRRDRDFAEMVIPENQFFVMGDNRTDSLDSRVFGLVDRELILGQAIGIAGSWNSESNGFRMDRFFHELP